MLPEVQETWVGKIPWRGEWHPTPVSLPGESCGQRSLGGYSPWGRKVLDVTEQLTLSQFSFEMHSLQCVQPLSLFLQFPSMDGWGAR